MHTYHRYHQSCKNSAKNWSGVTGVFWHTLEVFGWKDHAYKSDGISACPPFCLGEVKALESVWEVICVVTLDEVKGCLVGPHPICVEVGIFLCSC